jgi:hypothetical protein
MKNYIGNLYNRKTYLIKILNNLTLAKKYFKKMQENNFFIKCIYIFAYKYQNNLF